MRQHHKKIQSSGKTQRRSIYARGLEILKTMERPVDENGNPVTLTKALRRKMFAAARKLAKAESKSK